MKTKMIIIGTIFTMVLMLLTPCISAVNVQTANLAIKERVTTIKEKLLNFKIINDEMYTVLERIISFLKACYFCTPLPVLILMLKHWGNFLTNPDGYKERHGESCTKDYIMYVVVLPFVITILMGMKNLSIALRESKEKVKEYDDEIQDLLDQYG